MRQNVIFLPSMNLLRRYTDKERVGGPIGRPLRHEKDDTMYLSNMIRAFAAWRRYRSGVRELADLDDRTLADIGLNRTQIRQAAWHGR